MTELLSLNNLSKYYMAGQTVTAGLNGISLAFARGEFVAITGESGSGKSTLSHVVAGILPYEGGELYVQGHPTSHYDGVDWEDYRRDWVSFISQDYGILPGSTVLENVVSALRLIGIGQSTAEEKAEEILRQVELWEMKKRRAAKLSSGQKQRLAIARALAKPTPILVADEPTGNLDPENSRKVIQLLAQAATERLVLLVTHDFEEAADYVTRRIVLQDGRVTADSHLRDSVGDVCREERWEQPATEATEIVVRQSPVNEVREQQDTEKIKSGKPAPARLGRYAAGLQLRARPVWAGFMTVFFAFTIFAVFAILGTFYVNLDDVSTRYYDGEAFLNGDDTRIVVRRKDGADFTEEDFETLLQVKHIQALEPYDLALDVNYYYREGVDYEYRYRQDEIGMMDEATYSQSTVLTRHTSYIHVIPMLAHAADFLTAGELPDEPYEVVAVGDAGMIGTEISVYVLDRKNWGADSYLYFDMTITGVTDYGEGLYFSEEMGRMMNQNFLCKEELGIVYGCDPALADHEMAMTKALWVARGGDHGEERAATMRLPNANDMEERYEMHQVYALTEQGDKMYLYNDSKYIEYIELSPAMFEKLTLQGTGPQISLFMEDYSYTDRVIEVVSELGYEAMSPYRLGSVKQSDQLAQERMVTLGICLLAITAIFVLQILVVRAMFSLQMSSYQILRDMGLTSRTARYSVLWQTLLLTLTGQMLGLAILFACPLAGVSQVTNILKYLSLPHVLLLCGLHLLTSMITVLWTNEALRRQVFPFARRDMDLEWEERPIDATVEKEQGIEKDRAVSVTADDSQGEEVQA